MKVPAESNSKAISTHDTNAQIIKTEQKYPSVENGTNIIAEGREANEILEPISNIPCDVDTAENLGVVTDSTETEINNESRETNENTTYSFMGLKLKQVQTSGNPELSQLYDVSKSQIVENDELSLPNSDNEKSTSSGNKTSDRIVSVDEKLAILEQ